MKLQAHLAFEGDGEDARVVRVQLPPDTFFDDEPPDDDGKRAQAELLWAACDLIARGPKKSFPVRLAALRLIAGHERRPTRAVARDLGVSHSTVLAAESSIRRRLKLTKIREVK